MNLSVSHPLDSSPEKGSPWQRGVVLLRLIEVCWKTSRNAKASPTRGGGIERSEDVGEVVQSSTCVIPLTLKASLVQPLRRLRRQLPWQGSPWQGGFVSDETKWSGCEIIENVTARQSLSCQERWHRAKRRCRRGFVFDETDLRLLENVTECQSLSLWERCLRSRRRGQGCCQRARHTAIRTLLVRAIVSQRRWSNFTGLALSGADAPALLAGEPLAKRFRFR